MTYAHLYKVTTVSDKMLVDNSTEFANTFMVMVGGMSLSDVERKAVYLAAEATKACGCDRHNVTRVIYKGMARGDA